jgi:hypothetical protein
VVDWRELIPRLRAGDWTCAQHGRVVPDDTAGAATAGPPDTAGAATAGPPDTAGAATAGPPDTAGAATAGFWDTAPVVPICPHCGQMVRRVGFDRRGVIFFAEPSPARCAGPDAHPLGPNRVLLGWFACTCAPASAGPGGHRTWRCTTCGDLQQWPPHTD